MQFVKPLPVPGPCVQAIRVAVELKLYADHGDNVGVQAGQVPYRLIHSSKGFLTGG